MVGEFPMRSKAEFELNRKALPHTIAHTSMHTGKAMRKRQVWVESLFGEGKQWHEMERFRLPGLQKVNVEGAMKAAGQNIKRLLNAVKRQKP